MIDTNKIISIISNIRDSANNFIIRELKANNITELAPSHGAILYTLFQSNEQLRMNDIALRINKDKSTVTALINKMVKLGYVQRVKNSNDSRITHIELTPEGEALKPLFINISNNLLETTYKGLKKEEKEELIVLLEKINNNF